MLNSLKNIFPPSRNHSDYEDYKACTDADELAGEGRFEQAELLVLPRYERANSSGKNGALTSFFAFYLARIYGANSENEKAESFYRRAILEGDADIIISAGIALADLLEKIDRWDDACEVYHEVHGMKPELFQQTTPQALPVARNFGVQRSWQIFMVRFSRFMWHQPVLEDVLALYKEIIEDAEARIQKTAEQGKTESGRNYLRIAQEALEPMASLYHEMEEFETSEHYYRQAIDYWDEGWSYGHSHYQRRAQTDDWIINTFENLAIVLQCQERNVEADEILEIVAEKQALAAEYE